MEILELISIITEKFIRRAQQKFELAEEKISVLEERLV